MTDHPAKFYPMLAASADPATGFVTGFVNCPKAKMLSLAGEGKKCLELGCGTGSFTKTLQTQGFQVWGVDINAEMLASAASFCVQTREADLNIQPVDALFPGERFDLIFLGDVLEHLIDPRQILHQCKSMLQAGGCVIASIPNVAHGAIRLSLLQGDFNYTRYGILDDTHLRFFTRATIFELFEQSGYGIDQVDATFLAVGQSSSLVPRYKRDFLTRVLLKKMKTDLACNALQYIVRAFPRAADAVPPALRDHSAASFAQFQKSVQRARKSKKRSAENVGH